MSTINDFAPINTNGKIIQLNTEEECLKYFKHEDYRKINDRLQGTQKLTDFLPFFIEYLEVDTFTVDTDLVYSTIPQIISCKSLIFDGGSITSFVQLLINATATTLQNPSSANNYQIKVVGAAGGSGTDGTDGDTGSNGMNGQSKSCEDGENGQDGKLGNPGTDAGHGQQGGDTPISNLTLGAISLKGSTLFTVLAQGGNGGNGGTGGAGGTGGSGGNGGEATSTGCTCYNNGGNGGSGGVGGTGGKGGNAGNGSSNNQGMIITVATQEDKGRVSSNGISGSAGLAGKGGAGGARGSAGSGGSGTKHGHYGSNGSDGDKGVVGGDGNGGSNGTLPQITVNSAS